MTLDISNLDHDQKAYFDHLTRPASSDYEMVQRRDQLRTDLSDLEATVRQQYWH